MNTVRALGLAAELNGLGLAAYFSYEPIARYFGWEPMTVMTFMFIFVLMVWTARALYVANRNS